MDSFPLSSLNVFIGANGSGKSNLLSFFQMLRETVEGRLQHWTRKQGMAERVLSFGVKSTSRLVAKLQFGVNSYLFSIEPTADGGFSFAREQAAFDGVYYNSKQILDMGSGHPEAKLKERAEQHGTGSVADYVYTSISRWTTYHFHDTSATAGAKGWTALHDNASLRGDASNIAAYLHALKQEHHETYRQIEKTIALAIPFFDQFMLSTLKLKDSDEMVQLRWRQKNNDYTFLPSQLSDGALRFICLVTVLCNPMPPPTVIIDEPELGLHPYAITLLGSLMKAASQRTQLIVATQSVSLLNSLSPENLVVVERVDDASTFRRCNADELQTWLADYSLGELWEKNILGGRPTA
jgi:predicted ATPase